MDHGTALVFVAVTVLGGQFIAFQTAPPVVSNLIVACGATDVGDCPGPAGDGEPVTIGGHPIIDL